MSFYFDSKWELWEPVKIQSKTIHSIDETNIELHSNTVRGNPLPIVILLAVCYIFSMKNLFGIFKKSNDNNFEKFVIRKLSDDNSEIIDNLSNEGKQLTKEKVPPQWLSYVSIFAILIGLLFAVSILLAKDGFVNALQTRGYFFYIGVGLFIAGVVTQIIVRIKTKKSNSDPEVEEYVSRVEKTVKECEFELDIPETAVAIDVLFTIMKKNAKGEEKLSQMALIQFLNQELKVFVEKDLFCFADNVMVIGIPINSFKGIKIINKKIPLPQWNKSEPFNGPSYKPFKLYTNQTGFIWMKPYYEIDFEVDGEQYYFLLPSYEKDSFLKALGIEIPNIE